MELLLLGGVVAVFVPDVGDATTRGLKLYIYTWIAGSCNDVTSKSPEGPPANVSFPLEAMESPLLAGDRLL